MRRSGYCAPLLLFIICSPTLFAQNFREKYESFREQSIQEHINFREACNNRYIGYMLEAWKLCEAQYALEQPQEEWWPPVKMDEEIKQALDKKVIPSETVIVPPRNY